MRRFIDCVPNSLRDALVPLGVRTATFPGVGTDMESGTQLICAPSSGRVQDSSRRIEVSRSLRSGGGLRSKPSSTGIIPRDIHSTDTEVARDRAEAIPTLSIEVPNDRVLGLPFLKGPS